MMAFMMLPGSAYGASYPSNAGNFRCAIGCLWRAASEAVLMGAAVSAARSRASVALLASSITGVPDALDQSPEVHSGEGNDHLEVVP